MELVPAVGIAFQDAAAARAAARVPARAVESSRAAAPAAVVEQVSWR